MLLGIVAFRLYLGSSWGMSRRGRRDVEEGNVRGEVCVFITAGPMIKLCAGGEGDSEGHVL